MTALRERIGIILNETGCSLEDLSKAAGVSRGTAGHWATGHVRSIKLEYALGIQEKFGYSAAWIVLGKGSKIFSAGPNVSNDDDIPPKFLALAQRLAKLSSARLAKVEAILDDQEHLDVLERGSQRF